MFIFAKCLRSSAAVTPAKYEQDIIQVTIVFVIRKNWERDGEEKIGWTLVSNVCETVPHAMKRDDTTRVFVVFFFCFFFQN